MGATHFSGPVVSENGFEGNITIDAAITDITDSSGGTAGDEIVAVTDTSATDQSGTINDNFASLAAKIQALIDALVA